MYIYCVLSLSVSTSPPKGEGGLIFAKATPSENKNVTHHQQVLRVVHTYMENPPKNENRGLGS